MARDVNSFTLYWSSFQRFENCPQGFLWNRGWPTIDLGAGLGRKKPKPFKKSEHHAIMGISVQYALERLYNDELWKLLTPTQLRDRLVELGDKAYRLETARHFIDWSKAPSHEEMKDTIRKGILGYIRTLKHHRLLGPYARAEEDLVGYVNKWTPIGGRADMLIRRDDTGVTILDGKNSRRYKDRKGGWMTYTDPDQLRWYALCFYLSYKKVLPDRLGFVYYRYPYGDTVLGTDGEPELDENGEEKKEPGIVWVPFTMDDIKGLGQRANDVLRAMKAEKFEATPTPPGCRFCDYESVCPQRQAQKQANRRKPKGIDAKLDGIGAGGGFHNFSFGEEDGT